MAMIHVANLVKTFTVNQRGGGLRALFAPRRRTVTAVKDISFALQEGEMVGYLGPNGAGKSTTIKMLTGLLVPSSGEVLVDGMIPWKNRIRYVQKIGVVFGQRSSLWWDLPVMDSFDLLQAMYSIPRERYQRNLKMFREILELDDFLQLPVRSISLGQRMRAELCAALLHEPQLLFLDEPTIGLDVVAKERIRTFIPYVHEERHATIVLTTHDLTDIERLCERVMILDHGKILYDGALKQLLERFEGQRRLVVTLADPLAAPRLPGLSEPRREGAQVFYSFDPKTHSAAQILAMLNEEQTILDVEVRRAGLEDTIRRIYEQQLLFPVDDRTGKAN